MSINKIAMSLFLLGLAYLLWGLISMAHGDWCHSPRLATLNKSYHMDRTKKYNETHNGIGFECMEKPQPFDSYRVFHGVMIYTNSQYDDTLLLSSNAEWRVIEAMYVGVSGGVAIGYESMPVAPFVALTTRYRFVRLLYVPEIDSDNQAVWGLGLIYEF